MRFTNLLTLLAATSSLAYTIKRDDLMDSVNESTQIDTQATDSSNINDILNVNGSPNLNNITPECVNLVKNFNICFNGFDESSANQEACNRYNSNECKDLLKQDINACGPELSITYGAILSTLKAGCGKDEKGNNCPQFKLFDDNAVLTDTDIQEICKSKACTDSALEGFTELKQIATQLESDPEVAKDIQEMDKYINALNEDKCKAAAVTTTNNGKATAGKDDSSGAIQIKVGSTLLATLALALYLF